MAVNSYRVPISYGGNVHTVNGRIYSASMWQTAIGKVGREYDMTSEIYIQKSPGNTVLIDRRLLERASYIFEIKRDEEADIVRISINFMKNRYGPNDVVLFGECLRDTFDSTENAIRALSGLKTERDILEELKAEYYNSIIVERFTKISYSQYQKEEEKLIAVYVDKNIRNMNNQMI